jgi:hypothetical protein
MKTFTPSATSSVVAGIGFWALVWSLLIKSDRATKFFGVKTNIWSCVASFVYKEPILALSITELINYSVHGISNPLSVMFALGGTICNVIMISGIKLVGFFATSLSNEKPKLQVMPANKIHG